MQILKVDLENIKSYASASVPFALGTNAICGVNGAGKSTLLEAIGFALFDYLAVPQAEFVREGAKTAAVTVHVIGEDDRLYQVTRRCGGTNQYSVYDPDLDQKIAEGKADTLVWSREFLGLDEAGDPSALFRDAVGVPQGLLTSAFLDRPANRKNTFGPLLRVDEYDQAWSNLREPRRGLELMIARLDTRIAGLEGEVRDLPAWRSRGEELAAALTEREARRATVAEQLAVLAERRTALETLKVQIEDLREQATHANAEVQALAARVEEAEASLQQAIEAQGVVTETEPGHRAYVTAQTELNALEVQRKRRDALSARRQSMEQELAKARVSLNRLIDDLTEVGGAEKVMEGLRPKVAVQEQIEANLREARLAADRLETVRQTLKREQTRLAEMRTGLEQMQSRLAERETISEKLATLQANLEPIDTRWEKLNAEVAGWLAEREGLERQQRTTADRIGLAKLKADHERALLGDLETKLTILRADLEKRVTAEGETVALTQTLLELAEQITALTQRKATQEATLAQVNAQVEVLDAADTPNCPVCEGPLTPQHRSDLLKRYHRRQSDCETTLKQLRAKHQAVEKIRRGQQERHQELERLVRTLPRAEEEENLLAQVTSQRDAITESEDTIAQEQTAADGIQTRLTELAIVLDGLGRERSELEARRMQMQKERERLERHVQSLPRPDEAAVLAERILQQDASVVEDQHAVDALAGAPDQVKHLDAKLSTLGDPRRAYQRAADTVARRVSLEAEQTTATANVAALEENLQQLQQELDVFQGVEGEIERSRSVLTNHEPTHQRYLQHFREAQATDERRTGLSGLLEQCQIAESNHDALAGELATLRARFDAPALTDLTKRHGDLREALAGLDVEIRERLKQQSEALDTVQRLQAVEVDLAEARVEQSDLQGTLGLLDQLRQVLHDAGPQLTRALAEAVSIQADYVYADIMQDYGSRLRWTDDYDIVLSYQGRDRTFQQLSGGEQMAAALAVRLALLREVSSIDVAFFDEPTANLDRDRRANLARQILNVKGFAQLFVISHDDTFEQDTDHVVRIEKHNGASRVEA